MSPDIQNLFDKELCSRSFVCDAASWSVVSRPRLWWVSALAPPAPNEPLPLAVCGGLGRWRKYNRFWQLLPSSSLFPCQSASSCNTATPRLSTSRSRKAEQFSRASQPRRPVRQVGLHRKNAGEVSLLATCRGGRKQVSSTHPGSFELKLYFESREPTGHRTLPLVNGCRVCPAVTQPLVRNTNGAHNWATLGTVPLPGFCCVWFWCSARQSQCRQTPRASGTHPFLIRRKGSSFIPMAAVLWFAQPLFGLGRV